MTCRRVGFMVGVLCGFSVGASFFATAWADGPADNLPDNVRPIPKPGIEVSDADRESLSAGLNVLAAKLRTLQGRGGPLGELLPDVEIYHRAVDQALRFQEFFAPNEVERAKGLLKTGIERADQLLQGGAPWTKQSGLVVRGYRSKIDRTVQPYGLVAPESAVASGAKPHRLDLWFHGRGETLSEVNFIHGRTHDKGEFTPPNVLVLHPYGRYCNANKFAGEIDSLEAIEHAQRHYSIDSERIAVRGFSMGGAAAWQFAVHYPGRWFAANPGAGFSETPRFLNVFQQEKLAPSWFEQKLWRWYDCDLYAANLRHLPVVAYSGDQDKQKQAADVMEAAMAGEKLSLLHVIGPMTAHKIHPDSKPIIETKLAEWAEAGRSPKPRQLANGETDDVLIQFTTPTLRYNQASGLSIDGLVQHWEFGRVVVKRGAAPDPRAKPFPTPYSVATSGVTAFTLQLPLADWQPKHKDQPAGTYYAISIDGQAPIAIAHTGDKQTASFSKSPEGTWKHGSLDGLRKSPGLQGPIDDAFLDSFVFVKPSKPCRSPAVDAWVQREFDHAVKHWRQQMRGDVQIRTADTLTSYDIENSNVVYWGDAEGNPALATILNRLPVTWNEKQLKVGDASFAADVHVPVLIYPNPMTPNRYVVLNSSFTYREYDYLNNARQTPKLPDWAVVDATSAPSSRWPGRIVDAGFFDEQWKWKARPAESR